jgi:NAD(P)-dependent dehydrogenase (short-subunit alcohol dehydrogenase family)
MSTPALDRVVVTGAASGIGRATARALMESGARVTAIDVNEPDFPVEAWHRLDLGQFGSPLPPLGGPFDALVNAAGLPPRAGLEAHILRVNVFGPRRLTLHLLPALSPGAAIVNMASKAGSHWRENIEQVKRLLALPETAPLDDWVAAEGIDPVRAYDLSKEAVIVWTRAMTGGLIDAGLRMNCVSPAAVDTPILGDFVTAFGARAERGIALTRRAGTPEEVAQVIAFLCSPASGWVRGVNLEVDGGLSAQLDAEKLAFAGAITPP